jgi:hypothetical protein
MNYYEYDYVQNIYLGAYIYIYLLFIIVHLFLY